MTTQRDIEALGPVFVRQVETQDDLEAVQRLRYAVFIEEMGGDGPMVDHDRRLERDAFDATARHLMLMAGDDCVGTFRFMPAEGAARAGGFYTEHQYDLGPLKASGLRLMECGRSCLAPGWRGGEGMHLLWRALAREVEAAGAEALFGVASFPGRDPAPHRDAISLLHHAYHAPAALAPIALSPIFEASELTPPDRIDRLSAMRDMPALIKAYLRLGGMVGKGAFVDTMFNTTDVCMVLPVAAIPPERLRRLIG